jgi:hypothetical protein
MQLQHTLQQRLVVCRNVDTRAAMAAWCDISFAATGHAIATSKINLSVRPGSSQPSTASHLKGVGCVVKDAVNVALHWTELSHTHKKRLSDESAPTVFVPHTGDYTESAANKRNKGLSISMK